MRIYEGSPRQDFEEVFRSIGAFLDQRGMKDVLLLEAPDGFIVQGLVMAGGGLGMVGDRGDAGQGDPDLPRRRHRPVHGGGGKAARTATPNTPLAADAGYERALRVIGRCMDEQKPRDVFFFEQEGAFVVRLLVAAQHGSHHIIAEFTRDDLVELVERGPRLRHVEGTPPAGS